MRVVAGDRRAGVRAVGSGTGPLWRAASRTRNSGGDEVPCVGGWAALCRRGHDGRGEHAGQCRVRARVGGAADRCCSGRRGSVRASLWRQCALGFRADLDRLCLVADFVGTVVGQRPVHHWPSFGVADLSGRGSICCWRFRLVGSRRDSIARCSFLSSQSPWCCSTGRLRLSRRIHQRHCGRRVPPTVLRTPCSSCTCNPRSWLTWFASVTGWPSCSGSGCSGRCSGAGGTLRHCSGER